MSSPDITLTTEEREKLATAVASEYLEADGRGEFDGVPFDSILVGIIVSHRLGLSREDMRAVRQAAEKIIRPPR